MVPLFPAILNRLKLVNSDPDLREKAMTTV